MSRVPATGRVAVSGRVAASSRQSPGAVEWVKRWQGGRVQTTEDGTWIGSDGIVLAFLGGRFLRMFGWITWQPTWWNQKDTTNEVWGTNGTDVRTWTRLLPHDDTLATGTTRPRRRHTPGQTVMAIGGTPYQYIIGGDPFDHLGDALPQRQGIYDPYPTDCWRTADGVTWQCMTDATPWTPRVLMMAANLDGKLYVMGGQSDITDNTSGNSEVWRSTDEGANWTQIDDAPWTPRGGVYSPVEWRGEIWLPGGFVYGTPQVQIAECWSFDGTTWTQHADPPWAGKSYISCAVWDDRLWVLSGNTAVNTAEVWSTDDGETWTREEDLPNASHADAVCVVTAAQAAAAGDPGIEGLWYTPGNYSCPTFIRYVYQLRRAPARGTP